MGDDSVVLAENNVAHPDGPCFPLVRGSHVQILAAAFGEEQCSRDEVGARLGSRCRRVTKAMPKRLLVLRRRVGAFIAPSLAVDIRVDAAARVHYGASPMTLHADDSPQRPMPHCRGPF